MIPSEPASCVGIDLGTTFSCVAVFEDGDVTVINNRVGRSITPSVLFQPADGSDMIVGDGARDAAAEAAGTLVYDAKRFIGKRYEEDVALSEARGLPFDLVPGQSKSRAQAEPHLRLDVGGQPARFAPEDVGTLIVHQLKLAAEQCAFTPRPAHERSPRPLLQVTHAPYASATSNARRYSLRASGRVPIILHEHTHKGVFCHCGRVAFGGGRSADLVWIIV